MKVKSQKRNPQKVKFLKRLPDQKKGGRPRLEPTLEQILNDPEGRWGLVRTYATEQSARAMATYIRRQRPLALEVKSLGLDVWARRKEGKG